MERPGCGSLANNDQTATGVFEHNAANGKGGQSFHDLSLLRKFWSVLSISWIRRIVKQLTCLLPHGLFSSSRASVIPLLNPCMNLRKMYFLTAYFILSQPIFPKWETQPLSSFWFLINGTRPRSFSELDPNTALYREMKPSGPLHQKINPGLTIYLVFAGCAKPPLAEIHYPWIFGLLLVFF